MALTAQQICELARQIAKVPGFKSQSGQLLNMVLADLAQTYDFSATRVTFNFNFNTALQSGPIPLPADYLRAESGDVFYVIDGVRYILINIDLAEFDALVQTAGLNNFPTYYATDMSTSPPSMYVWMPPSGAYPVTIRYHAQPADITTPETSSAIPWFPNQTYLYTRVAGELCKITDDERWQHLLGDGAQGAEGILRKYLMMEGDRETRAKRVTLDRRRFGGTLNNVPTTKQVGWP